MKTDLPLIFSCVRRSCVWLAGVFVLALAAGGCKRGEEPAAALVAPPAVLVTVTAAQTRDLEILEKSVGSMEGLVDPTVGAEIAARVVQVLAHAGQSVRRGQLVAVLDAEDYSLQRREAQAEIKRLEALIANQAKVVERNQRLVQRNFIAQSALDDVATQETALLEQLEGARARLATIEHNGAKSRVYSPLDGRVEKQIVSPGDFVRVGDPLMQIIGTQKLRAHLPFPENVAARLRAGQTIRLSTPTSPDAVVTTTIREIKPLIDSANRAADVIADVVDQAGWHPGASVNGAVVLGVHHQAVVVPEQSIVLRPAGEVVYIVRGGLAAQRVVKTGLREQGMVEIVAGLAAGETVAMDGAAFLTDRAQVKVQPPRVAAR